ncbi:MAG: hypothetical protein IT329_16050 [Caldilineaceae bacterium]|nr:hypothetical protein [Caldilineaceae bacterium]
MTAQPTATTTPTPRPTATITTTTITVVNSPTATLTTTHVITDTKAAGPAALGAAEIVTMAVAPETPEAAQVELPAGADTQTPAVTPPGDLPVTGAARQDRAGLILVLVLGVLVTLAGWAGWERRGSLRQ